VIFREEDFPRGVRIILLAEMVANTVVVMEVRAVEVEVVTVVMAWSNSFRKPVVSKLLTLASTAKHGWPDDATQFAPFADR
jgi:hypothetical protein